MVPFSFVEALLEFGDGDIALGFTFVIGAALTPAIRPEVISIDESIDDADSLGGQSLDSLTVSVRRWEVGKGAEGGVVGRGEMGERIGFDEETGDLGRALHEMDDGSMHGEGQVEKVGSVWYCRRCV